MGTRLAQRIQNHGSRPIQDGKKSVALALKPTYPGLRKNRVLGIARQSRSRTSKAHHAHHDDLALSIELYQPFEIASSKYPESSGRSGAGGRKENSRFP